MGRNNNGHGSGHGNGRNSEGIGLDNDIIGDDSVAYTDWKEYEVAVEEGREIKPRDIKPRKREEYEFNVDKALDNIDLLFNGYMPSKQAIEFFNIIRLVMGEDPEADNSLMHYFLVDLVFGNIKRDNYPYSKEIRDKIRINERKIAIIAARGSAKSTIITAFLPIYLAIKGEMPNFGNVMFVVGFGDSQQAGAKVQANTIRDICEDSAFCKEYFEKMRFTDEECEFLRRVEPGKSSKVKDRAFMYKVKGAAGGSVRGIRYKTERPQMFLFDDIIKNEADANSKIIMAKLKSMIYSDAENALSAKKGKIIIINTPFNKADPVYQALEGGVWTPICLPICEKISLDIEREEYIGAWESMHNFERVKERYEDAYYGNTLREFNQELMLRISNDEDRMVQESMIQWYSRANMERKLSAMNMYITTDFTTTGSKGSDLSGIATWAVGSNQDYFLIDLCLRKQEMETQYEEVFRMNKYWGNKNGRGLSTGVETDGQQNAHVLALKDRMVQKNEWFTIARQKGANIGSEGIKSKLEGGNKHWRFRMMLPLFQNKKIWFPEELRDTPDMIELLEEIRYTSYSGFGSKHDDGIDLISQLGMMDIIFPMRGLEDELDTYNRGRKLKKRTGIWARLGENSDEYDNAYASYS